MAALTGSLWCWAAKCRAPTAERHERTWRYMPDGAVHGRRVADPPLCSLSTASAPTKSPRKRPVWHGHSSKRCPYSAMAMSSLLAARSAAIMVATRLIFGRIPVSSTLTTLERGGSQTTAFASGPIARPDDSAICEPPPRLVLP
ncbi:hypothetical protein CC86DRAFT_386372 [Ophiobolus disseminans]|uniref:Uncharacterized protein n=1 Tax=Ophiobolus disseminans TaxID=1469910 RepID=A0A6A6ZMF0_9PLEO|nr:hypothetical protein CC86DRAFT_386372 [Ophiobolus disseminans]